MIYDNNSKPSILPWDVNFRMTKVNPTMDELKKLMVHCCGLYTSTTDMVWHDEFGEITSMEKLFPRPNGDLGSVPTIRAPVPPTDAELADPLRRASHEARYKRECDLEAKIKAHILAKSCNISQMITRTISPGMLSFLKSTVDGLRIMTELGKPLEMINFIMQTDFSVGSQLIRDPTDKYYKARTYFESRSVIQWDYETSTVFLVRFNAEYSKVTLCATTANCVLELPSAQFLAYMFLSKLLSKYDPLRQEYEKGLRIKPTTADGIVAHCLFWDNTKLKHTPEEKQAYYVSQLNKKSKIIVNTDKTPVTKSDQKCRLHKTDSHVYNDEECKKAKAAYRAAHQKNV
jgi:hypothetical protein